MQRRSYFGYGVPCNPMDPVDPKGKRPKIQVFKLLLALSVASASMNDARKRFRQFRAVSQLVGRIFCCRKRRNWKTGSANTHKLNHKPCFCVGLLYVGEEKKGKMRKRYSFEPPKIYNHWLSCLDIWRWGILVETHEFKQIATAT